MFLLYWISKQVSTVYFITFVRHTKLIDMFFGLLTSLFDEELDYLLSSHARENSSEELVSVCRCGIQLLYQCAVRDVEFSAQLAHNEGHLIEFCELMRGVDHSEAYTNMLSELASTLQSTPEDMPPSFHRQPWLKSFESFSLVD